MLPTPEDHVAICGLLARYCLTLDLDDVESWVGLFTPDASYEVYGRTPRTGAPTVQPARRGAAGASCGERIPGASQLGHPVVHRGP